MKYLQFFSGRMEENLCPCTSYVDDKEKESMLLPVESPRNKETQNVRLLNPIFFPTARINNV